MLTRFSFFLCLMCAIVLVGCSKSESNTNGNAKAGNANKPASATTPATHTAPVATAEKIGVPECDEFIANYEACVTGKVPEAARAQYKTAIDQWRTSWKKLADNPQTKPSLVMACKQSAEQARASMKMYNCTF
jgi:hypothetical protein